MGLYCSSCKNEVPEGFSQCIACKAGYVSQLVCSSCRQPVPRGSAICLVCDRPKLEPDRRSRQPGVCVHCRRELPPGESVCERCARINAERAAPVSSELTRRPAPSSFSLSVPMPGVLSIPEEYQAGKLGVEATVQIPPAHAAILNELSQLVALLHAMAAKLILLPGDGSRGLAKGMRNLATDIQEEIERRVGPQS